MDSAKINLLKNRKGQTLVEYVLLMAVVATISVTILNSDAFKKLLGKDSQIFKMYGKYIEFSYRHALSGSDDTTVDDGYGISDPHRSYIDPSDGKSRFFTPLEPYTQ